MNFQQFNEKFAAAPRGAKIVYFRGFLMTRRQFHTPEAHECSLTANEAYNKYLGGKAYLVQKKISDELGYDYIAIKR